jgi:multidrug resistance efflux pump
MGSPRNAAAPAQNTIAGGTQGRFSMLPSDDAAEYFVKVVQRVPSVKAR